MAKKSNSVKKSPKKTTNAKTKNKTAEAKAKNIPKIKPITAKSNPMKKNLRIIALIVIIACVIAAVFLAYNTDIIGSDEAKAQLTFDSESTVQVKHTGGEWTDAENEMDLYESDSVKTGEDSSAQILLFKGSIIRLDSNTEVTLKEIIEGEETSVTIQQDTGRTWSTIQKISGIDDYEVQTPTAVASVRGTSFDVNITEDGITIVSVINGSVNVSKTAEGTVYTVLENYSVTVDDDGVGDSQTFVRDEWINNNLLKDDKFKADLEAILREKIEPHLDDIADLLGWSIPEDELDVLVKGFINGEIVIPADTPDHLKEIFDLS